MKAKPLSAGALASCCLLLFAGAVRASSPFLGGIDPPGGQRGTDVDVVFSGERLQDAKGVLFYAPGIEAVGLDVSPDGKKVKAKFKIAPDCALGEHAFRVWTATGVSELRVFYTGPFPTVASAGKINDPAHAQVIPMNVTVGGVINGEETDYYSVEAKKGQRITAEVEGMRLGITMFDPWLGIMTKGGKMLAECDDSPLLLQDPLVSIIAPEDGTYLVHLRDSAYAGTDKSKYRLHVGTFPQPLVVYPSGGQAGQEVTFVFLGDPTGTIVKKMKLDPLENGESKTVDLYAEQANEIAPAPNPVRVSPFPNVMEVEPNDDATHATKTDLPLPLAFNGIISKKGDIDYFKFKAKKGDSYDFRVYARALRSPLDSVLTIYSADGKQLSSNDDSGGPDSYVRYKFPADGEYCLSVTDQIKNGGPDFTYRVEVTETQSELTLGMTEVVKDTQERQTVPVPKGNRYGALLRAKRNDFNGALTLASADLPAGVTMQIAPMPDNADTIPVVFEAAQDAVLDGKLCKFTATPADATKKVATSFEHVVDLIISNPNNTTYFQARVDKLPVAVTEEAPFKVHIVPSKVPLVQNGSMNLKVAVERKEGFKGAVEVALLYKPNGIGADNSIKIPEGKDEGTIAINAGGDAQARKWKIAVTASADAGQGQVWVCSPFEDLEVAPPYLSAKLDRGFVEQGQAGEIVCKLTQNKPFEGKAKLQLFNLPNKVTSQELEISATDQEVKIPIAADKTAQAAQKKDLFCIVTIMQDGEPITQSIAQGGIIRVGKAGEKK